MSTTDLFSGILQNFGIAAIAALLYDGVLRSFSHPGLRHTLIALVFAGGAVGSMSLPVELMPGIIFDLRTAFVVLAMSFGGWLAVGVATVCAVAFRLWLGGAGALSGAAGILICAAAGIGFAYYHKGRRIGLVAFALLGALTGVSMVTMFLLPYETAIALITKVGPFMLATNMLATMLVGGIIDRQRAQYERESTLTHEATTDALTRLANRRAFDTRGPDMMNMATQHHEACALMIIDIDHFKQINDTYGHDLGDRVLQHLADIVRSSVRTTDLVARYGGEEIALVLPAHDAKRAFSLAERLRRAVATTPYRCNDGTAIALSVSIGLCASDGVSQSPSFETAFKKADMALYRAKSSGRNRVEMATAA